MKCIKSGRYIHYSFYYEGILYVGRVKRCERIEMVKLIRERNL